MEVQLAIVELHSLWQDSGRVLIGAFGEGKGKGEGKGSVGGRHLLLRTRRYMHART